MIVQKGQCVSSKTLSDLENSDHCHIYSLKSQKTVNLRTLGTTLAETRGSTRDNAQVRA